MRQHDPTTPYLLLLLTVVSGAVDAISYLALGHVFVVNMTGNVVFLGFAAAGATEISLRSTAIALVLFLAGSAAGGRLGMQFAGHAARLLTVATAFKLGLTGAALAVAIVAHGSLAEAQRDVVIGLLAMTMGIQNASARRIGIPDLATTVLTMTLTALAADSPLAGGTNPRLGLRVLSVLAMLAGAFTGGFCVLHGGMVAALTLTIALLLVTSVLSVRVPSVETGNP